MRPSWFLFAALALGIDATPCSRTGTEPPAVVTLMASPDNSQSEAWIVSPDCTVKVETFLVRNMAFGASRDVVFNFAAYMIDRVDSVPSLTKILTLGGTLSQSIDLTPAKALEFVSMGSSRRASLDNVKFPSSVKSLAASVSAVDQLTFPASLTKLLLMGDEISSMKSLSLPSGLKILEVSGNKLAALDFGLPSSLESLTLKASLVSKLERITFPDSLATINFLDGAGSFSVVLGIQWPRALQTLKLGTVSSLELRESDFELFGSLAQLTLKTSQSSCSSSAELKSLGPGNVCVISDEAFDSLYVSAGGSPATQPPSPSASSTTKPKPGATASEGTTAADSSAGSSSSNEPTSTPPEASTVLESKSGSTSTESPKEGSSLKTGSSSGPRTSAGKSPASSTAAPSLSSKSPSTSELTSDKSAGSSSLLVIVAIAGSVIALAAVVIGCRVGILIRKSNTKDAVAFDAFVALEAASPSQEQATGSAGTSNEYLEDDVRNDKALLAFRINQGEVQLDRVIARGGFGVVFRGKCRDRNVVVKQMLPDTWRDDAALRRFMGEIRLCASLSHPKIVEFIGVTWSSLRDLPAVLEYMSGGDLHSILHKHTPPSPSDWFYPWTTSNIRSKASIAQDVAEAIAYLHALASPILHRDIKARNVLLDAKGNAKLSDFGISREIEDVTMTSDIGTAAWIAPEVLRGERYSEKADVFSFGVLLVEMDLCSHPYANATNQLSRQSMMASFAAFDNARLIVLVGAGKIAPTMSNDCPTRIQSLASQCLSFNAIDRPTIDEIVDQLQGLALAGNE